MEKYDLVIACVGNGEADEDIVNSAYKKSRLHNCNCRVLFIREPAQPAHLGKIQRLLKKATILGAEIIYLSAPSVSAGIIDYAEELRSKKRKALFLFGVSKGKFLPLFLKKGKYNRLKSKLGKYNAKVEAVVLDKSYNRNYALISPIFNFNGLAGMFEALLYVAAALPICLVLHNLLFTRGAEKSDVYLIYLIACIISSLRGGLIPGLIASVLSILSINFFFLREYPTLEIGSLSDMISLLIFFSSAGIAALLGSGTRKHIIEGRKREAYLNALLNISETLNRPLSEEEALSYIHDELEKLFGSKVAFFTRDFIDKDNLSLRYPQSLENFDAESAAAFAACKNDYLSTGLLTSVIPKSKWYFEPMMSVNEFEGILAVKMAESPLRYDANITEILFSFADLSATIIDRIEHTQILEESRVQDEKDKLRTMLLSSVSHDLKTPLASILGALDVYHSLSHKLSETAKNSLTQSAYQEALRLDSFITNILDMAKFESGNLTLNKEWECAKDLIEKALASAARKLGERKIQISNQDKEIHEIEVDANLMLRALDTLFDNISKYTPADASLQVSFGSGPDGYNIIITDAGPGIEDGMLEKIFNKYTRIQLRDTKVAGTGLGLPIAKYIIEFHGGNIKAFNNETGMGTSLQITLPHYRKLTKKGSQRIKSRGSQTL